MVGYIVTHCDVKDPDLPFNPLFGVNSGSTVEVMSAVQTNTCLKLNILVFSGDK